MVRIADGGDLLHAGESACVRRIGLEIVHAVQLERAQQLLEGTMPLKAISDFCGFENPNSLRKFFKSQTGKTMTEWRANCQTGGLGS